MSSHTFGFMLFLNYFSQSLPKVVYSHLSWCQVVLFNNLRVFSLISGNSLPLSLNIFCFLNLTTSLQSIFYIFLLSFDISSNYFPTFLITFKLFHKLTDLHNIALSSVRDACHSCCVIPFFQYIFISY